MSIGGHQSARALKTVWLTPPEIISALGGSQSFDLDPCSLNPRPFDTARNHIFLPEDGLNAEWHGRVWLNPPYTSDEIGNWLRKLAEHGTGTSLIFARTDTEAFTKYVWKSADSLLFLQGRLNFHHSNGSRSQRNAGAPSVLCAYGNNDTEILAQSGIKGHFVPLRMTRGVLCLLWSQLPSWNETVLEWVRLQGKTVSLSDAYKYFADHPKAENNPHYRDKIRQVLQRDHFERIDKGMYKIKEA